MNELIFSAPGRVELGGNHTDHQRGCVLAAAIDRTTRAGPFDPQPCCPGLFPGL